MTNDGAIRIAAARLALSTTHPYLGTALWALHLVAVPGLVARYGASGPIGVDEWMRLYYDPDVVLTWQLDELSGALYHEVGHVLRGHAARAKVRAIPPEMHLEWNIAGDCEINDDLAAEGVVLCDGAVYPRTLGFPNGLFAEEYYDRLLKQAKAVNGGGVSVDCGSCTDGHARPWEVGPKGNAEVPPGVFGVEAELIRVKTARDIQAAKARGSVPGWLQRWADERLAPKLNPWEVLRGAVRRAIGEVHGRADYTYRRPARRQGVYPDFILPGMFAPHPHVAFVIDTSGSMDDRELAQGVAEVDGVLRALGAFVTVLAVDAAVHVVRRVMTRAQVTLAGGGGTDMGVGIAAAVELRPPPNVIVVVTDGETPWPTVPPSVPVIVALTQKTSRYAAAPAWARVIDVSPSPAT